MEDAFLLPLLVEKPKLSSVPCAGIITRREAGIRCAEHWFFTSSGGDEPTLAHREH